MFIIKQKYYICDDKYYREYYKVGEEGEWRRVKILIGMVKGNS